MTNDNPRTDEPREHHKGHGKIPETKNIEEGSAKRNITRKHDHDPHRKEKKQHGGGGGKGQWNDLDDGSLDVMHTSDIVGEAVKD